jgi:hypothetical protein
MDRYQIALGTPKSSVTGYIFKPSKSAKKVLAYMRQCIQDEKEFYAVNIDNSTLDMAMVLLSQEVDVPILVKSENAARSMSVAYSHKRVYHKGNFPSMYSYALFHPDVDRKSVGNVKPFLLIRRVNG